MKVLRKWKLWRTHKKTTGRERRLEQNYRKREVEREGKREEPVGISKVNSGPCEPVI